MSAVTPAVAPWVALARRLGDPRDPLGLHARADLVRDGQLSPAMADRALATTTARYTPDALQALCDGSLTGRTVLVVLAASVPTAPLRALVLPWLRGAAAVRVKPSRHQPWFVATLCSQAPLDRVTVTHTVDPQPGDHVVAYGSDTTLEALHHGLPPGATWEGHGHGLGVAVVGPGQCTPDVAEALARDVADYDQRGCLSPQAIYVLGTPHEAASLARWLHASLAAQPPRGALDAAQAVAVMQWQGVMAVQSTVFLRGQQHAVAVLDHARAVTSPGGRCIAVVPVPDAAGVRALLEPLGRYLTCVGLAGVTLDTVIPADASPRGVPVGSMQDPPLDGPEDPRGAPAVTRR